MENKRKNLLAFLVILNVLAFLFLGYSFLRNQAYYKEITSKVNESKTRSYSSATIGFDEPRKSEVNYQSASCQVTQSSKAKEAEPQKLMEVSPPSIKEIKAPDFNLPATSTHMARLIDVNALRVVIPPKITVYKPIDINLPKLKIIDINMLKFRLVHIDLPKYKVVDINLPTFKVDFNLPTRILSSPLPKEEEDKETPVLKDSVPETKTPQEEIDVKLVADVNTLPAYTKKVLSYLPKKAKVEAEIESNTLKVSVHLLDAYPPEDNSPYVKGAYTTKERLQEFIEKRSVEIYRKIFAKITVPEYIKIQVNCCHGVRVTYIGAYSGTSDQPMVLYSTEIEAKGAAEHNWRRIKDEEIMSMWKVNANLIPSIQLQVFYYRY